MNVEYSAIAAKLKAMYSNFLTTEHYEQLLEEKTVNGIYVFLKEKTHYCNVLGELDESDVHRGQMEIILERELFEEYIRLYNFMDNSKRKIMRFWFMKREVDFLKREIRHIYTHERRSDDNLNQSRFDEFFKTHTKIDGEIMHNAKSLADCITACKNTPYAEEMKRAKNIGADLFSISMILDIYYYKSIYHTASQTLDQKQLTLFKELIGKKADMLNLMWIYRGKRYFNLKNEIIFTYLLPIRHRLTTDAIKKLVNTPNVDAFVNEVIRTTKYGELFDDCNNGKFPEDNYRYIYNKLSKHIFTTQPETMVAVFAYMSLKEAEINNITAAIEGIRYSQNPDLIRKHIGIE